MRVFLVPKGTGRGFSLEAGLSDGQRHFDHHQRRAGNPAPCRDERIPVAGAGDTVEITHLDGDTFVGLLRLAGRPLSEVDLALMERIDLSGSSACSGKFNPTLLYMVGVGQLARDLKFPRPSTEGPIEVTSLVEAMFAKTTGEIIEIGRTATERSEASYRDCLKARSADRKVGFWSIGAEDPLDPSRPYEDGAEVVVVYRRHYKSVSIYCSPTSAHAVGGLTVAGIEFAGHPKACGSPRGVAFSEEDAGRVFMELLERTGNSSGWVRNF